MQTAAKQLIDDLVAKSKAGTLTPAEQTALATALAIVGTTSVISNADKAAVKSATQALINKLPADQAAAVLSAVAAALPDATAAALTKSLVAGLPASKQASVAATLGIPVPSTVPTPTSVAQTIASGSTQDKLDLLKTLTDQAAAGKTITPAMQTAAKQLIDDLVAKSKNGELSPQEQAALATALAIVGTTNVISTADKAAVTTAAKQVAQAAPAPETADVANVAAAGTIAAQIAGLQALATAAAAGKPVDPATQAAAKQLIDDLVAKSKEGKLTPAEQAALATALAIVGTSNLVSPADKAAVAAAAAQVTAQLPVTPASVTQTIATGSVQDKLNVLKTLTDQAAAGKPITPAMQAAAKQLIDDLVAKSKAGTLTPAQQAALAAALAIVGTSNVVSPTDKAAVAAAATQVAQAAGTSSGSGSGAGTSGSTSSTTQKELTQHTNQLGKAKAYVAHDFRQTATRGKGVIASQVMQDAFTDLSNNIKRSSSPATLFTNLQKLIDWSQHKSIPSSMQSMVKALIDAQADNITQYSPVDLPGLKTMVQRICATELLDATQKAALQQSIINAPAPVTPATGTAAPLPAA